MLLSLNLFRVTLINRPSHHRRGLGQSKAKALPSIFRYKLSPQTRIAVLPLLIRPNVTKRLRGKGHGVKPFRAHHLMVSLKPLIPIFLSV